MRLLQKFPLVPQLGQDSHVADLSERHSIIAGYWIGKELGVGPLGKVYRAVHEKTGQVVAFRGFACPDGADPGEWNAALVQFRELLTVHKQIADGSNAPATIQKVVDFGEDNGLFWVATEYFTGKTLRAILDSEQRLSFAQALDFLRHAATAIDWMGSQGLAHTDLTPYNILRVENPSATSSALPIEVINFGLAHARDKFGSPYAAPEQMTGKEGDCRSDVYAVGAMLYEILCGKPPFSGSTPEEIALRILYTTAEPIPNRSDAIQAVLGAMLAKQPEARYSTVLEAIDDLAANRKPRFAHTPLQPAPPIVITGSPAPAAPPMTAKTEFPDEPALLKPVSPPQTPIVPPPILPVRNADPLPMTIYSGSGAVVSGVRPPQKHEIILQNFSLSGMDVLVLRWRQEQAKRKKADEDEVRREKRLRVLRPVLFVGLLFWLIGSGLLYQDSFRSVTVAEIQGSAMVRENGQARPLHVGDRLRADAHPILETKPGSQVTLALTESRVFLPENSVLQLIRLDYKRGVVRQMRLERGGVAGRLSENRRVVRYTIQAGEMTAHIRSGDFYITFPEGQPITATRNGKIQVQNDTTRHNLTEGAVTTTHTKIQPVPIAISGPIFQSSKKALAVEPETDTGNLFANFQESILTPVIAFGETVWKLPTQANDQKSVGLALASMQAVTTLLMTADSGDGLPTQLDLTLRDFGLEEKDRQRILHSFADDKLVSYHRLPGGYELYARANDTDHTLLRATNGRIEVVPDSEE